MVQSVSFSLVYFTLACLAMQACASITITSHSGSNEWWAAYSVSDSATTALELKDSGAYSSWKALTPTSWGYWTFTTAGSAITFPISFRVTAGNQQIVVNGAYSWAAPGITIDSGLSFNAGSSGPSTQAPSTAPTQRPVPTNAPATQAPATQAPATQAPTQKPTSAPVTQAPATQAPTQKPTSAPVTQAPTQKPTNAPVTQAPATQAPTQKPTNAPVTQAPVTQAPTQKPTNAPVTQAPTQKPTSAPGPKGNPFLGTQYYLNPHYLQEVDSSIADYPAKAAKFTKVKEFASAYWIDRMAVIDNVTTVLTQARLQSQKSGKQVMAALVIYDLPARDCAALASNGEIPCADAECAAGIATYKNNYIDKIIAVLKNFPDVTIVTVVEPDSLPNLATNLAHPKCTMAQKAYKTGVAYAIQQLATLSNVHIYIDAAHGGWLGWSEGRAKAVDIFAEVLQNAGGASKIRGFATNVANYQPLGSMTDTADPCGLATQWNFGTNEVKYVSLLDASFQAKGITGLRYIIDTGRNGVINARSDCSNWCNINRAGLGVPPTTNTASSGLDIIDAYFWVKPPGEGDGTSDTSAVRYDAHCGSRDSVIPAPEAGQWFSNYFAMLVDNANPSL